MVDFFMSYTSADIVPGVSQHRVCITQEQRRAGGSETLKIASCSFNKTSRVMGENIKGFLFLMFCKDTMEVARLKGDTEEKGAS